MMSEQIIMRTICFGLVLITVVSCKNKVQKIESIYDQEIEKIDQMLSDENNLLGSSELLVGRWKLCGVKSETSQTSYNVCTELSFYSDGKGLLKLPSNDIFNFNWKRIDNLLIISHETEKDKKGFFSDRNEFIINDSLLNRVELTPKGEHFFYYLSK